MRIIAHRTLVLFYTKHSSAKSALEEWYSKVSKANWETFADIKKDFNSVDSIGDQRYIFNIKGNDYRLVAVVKFKIKMVYIRYVGTHKDYDKIDCTKI
ncbi:MAG: type II toxin-antitoxin system HigB family toxin [Rikenellaceae bacterium]